MGSDLKVGLVAFVGTSIFLVLYFVTGETWFGETVVRNLYSLGFCMLVVCVFPNYELRGSILSWLGNISLEIFLLHEYVEYILVEMGLYESITDYTFLLLVILFQSY